MAVTESSSFFSTPNRSLAWFRGLTLATVLAAFGLVVLGGVVRVTGSGLGCPDWPLCQGGILPPPDLKAIIEYSHRVVASALLGPLVLVTCVTTWVAYRRERWLLVPATAALVLMLAQALLGGVTVLKELPGEIVAAHLALGQVLLACLTLLMVVAFWGPLSLRGESLGTGTATNFPVLALISGIGVFGILISGSYVTQAGATWACLDWPLCQGQVLPPYGLPMIHMAHRLFAAIVGIILMYTLYTGIKGINRPLEIRILSIAAGVLFLAQVLVAAAAVWLRFPVELRALHLALATLMWGVMVALVALSFSQQTVTYQETAHA